MSVPENKCLQCDQEYATKGQPWLKCERCGASVADEYANFAEAGVLVPWPKGERAILVAKAMGQMNAQILKGVLEAERIPVILQGERVAQAFGLVLGSLGDIGITVPESFEEEARLVLDKDQLGGNQR